MSLNAYGPREKNSRGTLSSLSLLGTSVSTSLPGSSAITGSPGTSESRLLTASPQPGIRPQERARRGPESRDRHHRAAPPSASPWLRRGFLTDLFLGESEQR